MYNFKTTHRRYKCNIVLGVNEEYAGLVELVMQALKMEELQCRETKVGVIVQVTKYAPRVQVMLCTCSLGVPST